MTWLFVAALAGACSFAYLAFVVGESCLRIWQIRRELKPGRIHRLGSEAAPPRRAVSAGPLSAEFEARRRALDAIMAARGGRR